MAGAVSLCCYGHKFSGSWKSKFLGLFFFQCCKLKEKTADKMYYGQNVEGSYEGQPCILRGQGEGVQAMLQLQYCLKATSENRCCIAFMCRGKLSEFKIHISAEKICIEE